MKHNTIYARGRKMMKKYIVYREDDEDEKMGEFKTREEAREAIKEYKRFDKENKNPFEEKYFIRAEEQEH